MGSFARQKEETAEKNGDREETEGKSSRERGTHPHSLNCNTLGGLSKREGKMQNATGHSGEMRDS